MSIRLKMTMLAMAVLAVGLMTSAPAQAQTEYNMKQAVERALEANPSMKAARYDLLSAEAGRKSARGAFGPSASATYGYTHNDHLKPNRDRPTSDQDVFTATFNIHQPLFTGFRVLSTYEKARLTEESAQSSVYANELNLIGSVQQNFLGLLKAREDVRSAKDSVARLEDQYKVTKAFYDVGLKPRLDVLQAEVDMATAHDALLEAENNVEIQTVRLNTLLDLPLDADVNYSGALGYEPFTLEFDQVMTTAMKDRPDLIIARKGVEIGLKDKKIAYSGMYPQVGADFDWSSYGNSAAAAGSNRVKTEYSAWSAGVSASWKLWDWGETYYGGRQASEKVNSLLETELNTRQEALYEVRSNYLGIRKAAESIKVNRKALEAAQEGYRMAVARYQAQVGTNTDVLDAQESLSKAEAGLTAALADYRITLSKMFVSMGEKNAALLSR